MYFSGLLVLLEMVLHVTIVEGKEFGGCMVN